MPRTTIVIPAGIQGSSTDHGSDGKWIDASNVRFDDNGEAQVIGGWERLTRQTVNGVCRTAFAWTDNADNLGVAFGTNSSVILWQGGGLYDITPTLALPSQMLATNALSTVANSNVVTVSQPGHGYAVGENVAISGVTWTTNTSVTANALNINATIINATTNTWTYTIANAATGANATANAGGNGIVITPARAYQPGLADGTGSNGFGTGAYGVGGWGEPSATDYFSRTWSFAAWGEQLLANPRGGTIHVWTNNLTGDFTPCANAPAKVSYMLVAPNNGSYQAFALGCSQEADGVFNPMNIRYCGIRDFTIWNTNVNTTAREYTLTGGGRIVCGKVYGQQILVWTDDALWIGSFVGNTDQPWSFVLVARNCGLIGPNAVAVAGTNAFWISEDRQFWSFNGSSVSPVPNPLREEFAANLAASQGDKIVASTISEYSEVRFDYPDARDGKENSRYLLLKVAGPQAGIWTKGEMARTAMVDAGPSQYVCGVDPNGKAYWHERGDSADGMPITWFIESGTNEISEEQVARCASFEPDFKDQVGAVTLTLFSRFRAQGAETSKSYTIPVGVEKVDTSIKGRYLRIRYDGNTSPTYMHLGKPVFDIRKSSRR